MRPIPKAPNTGFLKKLTTQTGVLQHTSFGVPDRSLGYALDDNARALLVAVRHYEIYKKKEWLDLAVIYLSFLSHSKREDGFFNNFQRFDHRFIKDVSQDAFGEVIWALGELIKNNPRSDLTGAAKRLFGEIKANIEELSYARSKAYALLGLIKIAEKQKTKELSNLINQLLNDLIKQYRSNKTRDWHWFENVLNYGNYILPAALFEGYRFSRNTDALQVAKESMKFLNEHSFDGEVPTPIGSDGWLKKGGEKPKFDQQPIDAGYAVLANIAAFEATGEKVYLDQAQVWFSWYHGNNSKKVQVCDPKTGTCFDAVTRSGVNENQGAESVICYLLANLALVKAYKSVEIANLGS